MDWLVVGRMRWVLWGSEERRIDEGRANRRHEPLKASILGE